MSGQRSDFKPEPKQALLQRAEKIFRERFGAAPEALSFAPGRVEVLGNHTDYNGGFVLSVALEQGIAAAAGRSPVNDEVEVFSELMNATARFSLKNIARDPERRWADYSKGVLKEILAAGLPLGGLRLALASDLPIGAGVSSSAALELAAFKAARALFGGPALPPMEEARLCQRAEVNFVGVPCGLLDQFSSNFGRENHLLFLDCAVLEHEALPIGRRDLRVVVSDCGVKHELADGQYAALRQSCERAARELEKLLQRPVRFLRDVGREEFARFATQVNPADRPRAEHVIGENTRVLQGVEALKRGDLRLLGKLMVESHGSSRDLFGNSIKELDALIAIAQTLPGFIGGKLSGGGFGGATVNFVEAGAVEAFSKSLAERYRAETGIQPAILLSSIGSGARAYRLG